MATWLIKRRLSQNAARLTSLRAELPRQPHRDEAAIGAAMHSGVEKHVKLEQPIPVHIAYFTAWVDGMGRLNFRDDIYEHDRKLAEELFSSDDQAPIASTAEKAINPDDR